jgi:hypothetical protein
MNLHRRMAHLLLVGALLAGIAGAALATTWAPRKVKCPLCETENQFQTVMSYGSYIYNWPSKFHFIFWPLTDGQSLYSCSGCRLTAFMGDFQNLPKDKLEAVKNALKDIKFDKDYSGYNEIPMTQRLKVAEKVYAAWGRDDQFWCLFYRVVGYHCDQEMPEAKADNAKDHKAREALGKEADAARRKAVEFADKLMADKDKAGQRKEHLLIRGAMRHFLKDDKAALADFEEAAKLTYTNEAMKSRPEAEKNTDNYLSGLIKEYTALLKKGQALPAEDPEKGADQTTKEFEKWLKDREQKDKEKDKGAKGKDAATP